MVEAMPAQLRGVGHVVIGTVRQTESREAPKKYWSDPRYSLRPKANPRRDRRVIVEIRRQFRQKGQCKTTHARTAFAASLGACIIELMAKTMP